MRAAVVRNDVESVLSESANDSRCTAAVVGDPVQIDKRASVRARAAATPSFEIDACPLEHHILADIRPRFDRRTSGRVKQAASAKSRKLTRHEAGDDDQRGHRSDNRDTDSATQHHRYPDRVRRSHCA
jgi:hypothetical protein